MDEATGHDIEYISADFGGRVTALLSEPRVVVYAEPFSACVPLKNPPADVADAVVVVERCVSDGQC